MNKKKLLNFDRGALAYEVRERLINLQPNNPQEFVEQIQVMRGELAREAVKEIRIGAIRKGALSKETPGEDFAELLAMLTSSDKYIEHRVRLYLDVFAARWFTEENTLRDEPIW